MFRKILCIVVTGILFLILSPAIAQAEKVYWIAYIASDHTVVPGKCMRGLCVVSSDNRENHLLTRDVYSLSPLSWSPDGKWIAYTTNQGDLYRIAIDERKPILIADRQKLLSLAGMTNDQIGIIKSLEEFTPIYDIVWSPDGTELFLGLSPWFPSSLPPINIYGIDINGNSFHEIVHLSDILAAYLISLSPDGKWLTYLEVSECRYCDFRGGRLYRVRLDGSDKQLLLDEMLNVGAYAWSSADNKIYYSYWESDETWSIYSINPDNPIRQLLLKNIDYDGAYGPSMTVNNNYLYYVTSSRWIYHKIHTFSLIGDANKGIPDLGGRGFKTISSLSAYERVIAVGSDLQITRLNGDFLYILDESGNFIKLMGYPIKEIYNPTLSPVPIS